jgi:hypothetical protein
VTTDGKSGVLVKEATIRDHIIHHTAVTVARGSSYCLLPLLGFSNLIHGNQHLPQRTQRSGLFPVPIRASISDSLLSTLYRTEHEYCHALPPQLAQLDGMRLVSLAQSRAHPCITKSLLEYKCIVTRSLFC